MAPSRSPWMAARITTTTTTRSTTLTVRAPDCGTGTERKRGAKTTGQR